MYSVQRYSNNLKRNIGYNTMRYLFYILHINKCADSTQCKYCIISLDEKTYCLYYKEELKSIHVYRSDNHLYLNCSHYPTYNIIDIHLNMIIEVSKILIGIV